MNGSTVVVVGGASGMGAQLCAELLARDCRVWMVGRSMARLEAARDRLRSTAAGRSAEAGHLMLHEADVTDDDQVRRLFETAGTIDHLVCTAADMRGAYERLADIDIDAIERAIRSKVLAPMLLARHGGARIAPGGSITYTSGVAAYRMAARPVSGAARCHGPRPRGQ